jgi:uncharacterized membrane protein YhfC
MKNNLLRLSFILVAMLLSACTSQSAEPITNIDKGAYVTGVRVNAAAPGKGEFSFQVSVPTDGTPVGVLLRGTLTSGEVYAVITASDGTQLWRSHPISAAFSNYAATVTTLPAGTHNLTIAWDGPVDGSVELYTVNGEAVKLAEVKPIALLGGVGMLLVAVGYAIYSGVRRLGWKYFFLGAGCWVVAVVLKFAWAIPLNTPIYNFLKAQLPEIPFMLIFNVYVGSLTGVFEVVLVWLLVRYTRIGKVTWQKALAFGIGFGAVEALLLGLASTANVLVGLLAPNMVPSDALISLAAANNVLLSLAPISERFFTVLIHIFSNVLIFYAAATRKPGWFWLSFVYKTLLDSVAAWAQLTGLGSLDKIWAIEAGIAVMGILGWWGTAQLLRRFPADSSPQPVTYADEVAH